MLINLSQLWSNFNSDQQEPPTTALGVGQTAHQQTALATVNSNLRL